MGVIYIWKKIMKELWYFLYAGTIALMIKFNIEPHLLWALTVLMLLDTISWWLKAWKLKEFSSNRMKVWLLGKALWLIILFWLWIVSSSIFHLTDLDKKFVSLFIWLMGVSELISMVQNYLVFKTGIVQNEMDAVTKLFSWLLRMLRKILEKYINKELQ
jgi:phage-related holin